MSKALAHCRRALHAASRQCKPRTAELSFGLAVRSLPSQCHPRRTYSTPSQKSKPSANSSAAPSPATIANIDSSKLVSHLNELFSPLQFPPELAARILTHASHKDAIVSHNARLSFIGRRVLKTYLLLYIHSSPSLHPSHDYDQILERTLNTYILGEHVAPKWSLNHVLKWTPVNIGSKVNSGDVSRLDPKLSRSVGLYKVMGTAVEAVVGGVYHQFGGSVAHRLFHTRVLPHLLLPGRPEGLHDAFHAHALEICEQMGGENGPLVLTNEGSASSGSSSRGEKSRSKDATP
ncbi:hypothetical protein K474DRAFT_1658017 [Panus rudis PR-1116 ss-1]|nr:hypothetical protein K474DRAFT_1658017 [Panus rudis PR-1116 ss-1]